MIIRKLALAALATALASDAAWAQSKPTYEEALTAVTDGGCERTETKRYVRFHCEEGEALWYFTVEGRPEHSAYLVAPSYPDRRYPDEAPVISSFSSGFSRGQPVGAKTQEEARAYCCLDCLVERRD